MKQRELLYGIVLVTGLSMPALSQARGAEQLYELVHGLTVTPRVLLIGARPTDADEDLIAWLARGQHVQTGFLSLTRGESAPNYTGLETGATLGAIHVQEMLAARHIDGGEQYFTRAYDFGSARNAEEALEQWDHDQLLGDVVAVVRAFRPQVIIALSRPDTVDRDGQHAVSAMMAREVFDAALDTVKFSVKKFGIPWTPTSLYEPGEGVTMDSRDFDVVRGRTYRDMAAESRAQLRSFGFATPPWRDQRNSTWRRIATRADETSVSKGSIFDGIDTTFARLLRGSPLDTMRIVGSTETIIRPRVYQLSGILAYADSARQLLDLRNPAAIIPYLKQVAELSSGGRTMLRGCRHPARDAAMSISYQPCKPGWLDLDASLDLIMRRSADALFNASGVTFDITADREFLASFNQALVTATVTNNGDSVVTVNDITITGGVGVRMTEPIRVAPHSSRNVYRQVVQVAYAHPYWIWKRDKNFYPNLTTSLDGVARGAQFNERFGINAVAVPENIRRLTEVTATIGIGHMTMTSSIGQVVYRTAEPLYGVRDRALSGVPPVTLTFERALEWAQANKPVKKNVRMILRSYSDSAQSFALRPGGIIGNMKWDALPPKLTLAPHEAKEVTLPVRGQAPENRYELPLLAVNGKDTMNVGFRTAQYSYLPPVHLFRESTLNVAVLDINIPSRLSVVYIRGAGDDADVGLKQLGVPVYPVNNEGLTRFDLDALSTVVFGPDAFRVDPNLITQMPRLLEFARKGGTVVMLSNPSVVGQPNVLPYPVTMMRPFAESVMREDAPVRVTDAGARVMTWPNVISARDWEGWTDARALNIPSSVDPHWTTSIEMHDPRQPENRNSILVAPVGKGKFVYTSLTLTQQISNAVPGAMRLLVNLLSAGLAVEK
jgi:LmbE family N-acetylglucosaminyl deacetylase